ncbi:MAG: hypothetical protein US86_C0009G0033 [Candidatus Daviesbacteria bacterium GW2011_GWA2_38_24]|uniref:Septum formation initiator n=1 Tax=Candidatus Daviesbacteria bacterium GW2011_GWA2_38_24 TaxID=1618422 RepID=A0A0G0JRD7_9BACT|nr:MAG: hypothetical protein US86_C0009G0033 [Candidatus Daviesbacteria bacterium GW2011_GWA2_38_24]OGE23490.1 MAG: hypothetical protein A2688_01610 [Candidatus Daviesbacteria bacterium RIFCSPHIGHO2_01_FULL_38_8]
MIRRVITIIFVTVALILIVGIVRQIYDALQSSKRLDAAADNFSKLQEENVRLKKRLTEVQEADFIEQQARNELNMVLPNETVVIIPEEELEKTVNLYKKVEPPKVPNYLKWLKLLWP